MSGASAGSSQTSVVAAKKAGAAMPKASALTTEGFYSRISVTQAGWLGFESEGCSFRQKPIVPTSAVSCLIAVGVAVGDGEGSVAAMTAQHPLQHFQCGGDIFKPWLDTNATVLVWSANRRVATALAGVPYEPDTVQGWTLVARQDGKCDENLWRPEAPGGCAPIRFACFCRRSQAPPCRPRS